MKKMFDHIIKNKKIYQRVVVLIIIVAGAIVLIQNINCGYDKDKGFYFHFSPAAKINLNVNK
ncbi:MAG: hypothetical protein JSW06_02815 [Thermoplasmatales archaeon]|nr:MAG: hypothetical protein JSW06_02815 [Thermoplasmatales archaeon]